MSIKTKGWLIAIGIAIMFCGAIVINNETTSYEGPTPDEKIHNLCKDHMGVDTNNDFRFICIDGSNGKYMLFADGSSEFEFYPMEK